MTNYRLVTCKDCGEEYWVSAQRNSKSSIYELTVRFPSTSTIEDMEELFDTLGLEYHIEKL